MNRQRLLTLAVAANAVLTIVALIRIYAVSNVIQSNLAELSGNLQQLGRDVETLHEQVQRVSSSVATLNDSSLQAVQATVTHLNGNLSELASSVANLQGFTKEQTQEQGALSQSISAFAGTLRSTGTAVATDSTTDGGPVQGAIADYRRELGEAGAWTLRQNSDPDGGLARTALTRYAGSLDGAGRGIADASQQYKAEVQAAAQKVAQAEAAGGPIASAQAAYSTALAGAGVKASDQVRERLERFFQDNQSALSRDLLKKIDARCTCSCGAPTPQPATTKAVVAPVR